MKVFISQSLPRTRSVALLCIGLSPQRLIAVTLVLLFAPGRESSSIAGSTQVVPSAEWTTVRLRFCPTGALNPGRLAGKAVAVRTVVTFTMSVR